MNDQLNGFRKKKFYECANIFRTLFKTVYKGSINVTGRNFALYFDWTPLQQPRDIFKKS